VEAGAGGNMTRKISQSLLLFVCGILLGHFALRSALPSWFKTQTVMAQSSQPPVLKLTRIYTGADNQSHAEEVSVPFENNALRLLPVTGAELHRGTAGSVSDWHPETQRMYVITLSGHGEIEVANGKKVQLIPGTVELVEDTRGKGHISRVTSSDDRVSIWLPLVDQTTK
jgi:hypothetical protein